MFIVQLYMRTQNIQLTLSRLTDHDATKTSLQPSGYRGLYAFHKYWGKKPFEPVRYLIQNTSSERGLVVDPFLGSGVSAIEALQLRRRFIGVDVNPLAIRLARLLVSLPSVDIIEEAFAKVASSVKDKILESYITTRKEPATHYLWRDDVMEMVWLTDREKKRRVELPPNEHDLALSRHFAAYQPQRLREPIFFANSRINSSPSLTLKDIFTGRALHNIELLLAAIDNLPQCMQEPMRLSLTAAAGQMSKMVFAITGRGKIAGARSGRIEVGSWVIGYWRPELHFEVNVWNCFEHRVQKLIKAAAESGTSNVLAREGELSTVCAGHADYVLLARDCLDVLPQIPDRSIDLLITDPPHSDRIPYLELSEIWNVILGEEPLFELEIVVSNARERAKTLYKYNQAMSRFLEISASKLSDNGLLVLFFNARTKESWKFLNSFVSNANRADIIYCGCFPLIYSAASVIQDNREGALRTDYGLVFARTADLAYSLAHIPGWMSALPMPGE